MGLLDDFNIPLDEVEAVSGFSIPDPGFYNFEVGAAFVKEGSANFPDKSWIIFEYLLEDENGADGGKISDMWELPVDPTNMTKEELTRMGRYKSRLLDLGFDESEINDVEGEDVVGITGTLHVVHNKGKGSNKDKTYANIDKVRVSADGAASTFDKGTVAEPEPEPEPEPAKPVVSRERRRR